jgi:hypothetical protein
MFIDLKLNKFTFGIGFNYSFENPEKMFKRVKKFLSLN